MTENQQLLKRYLRDRCRNLRPGSWVTEQVFRGHLVGYAESVTPVKSNGGATEYLADFVPSPVGINWIGGDYINLVSADPLKFVVEAPVFFNQGYPFTLFHRVNDKSMVPIKRWKPDWFILTSLLEQVAEARRDIENAETNRSARPAPRTSSGSTPTAERKSPAVQRGPSPKDQWWHSQRKQDGWG